MKPVNPFSIVDHLRKRGNLSERDLLEMEIYRSQWEVAAEIAEEVVEDMGYKESDGDDYFFALEQETKRQWQEELDREQWKRGIRIAKCV